MKKTLFAMMALALCGTAFGAESRITSRESAVFRVGAF